MADDGMLLNFELGDAPLRTSVKFKGGRWRDRVRAQKSVKNAGAPRPVDAAAKSSRPPPPSRRDDGRPAKRQRTDDAAPAGHPSQGPTRSGGGGQVTSRLFTSNPTPRTVFDDKPAAGDENAEPAKPSNAPLSEEAANFLALGLSRRIAQHLAAKLGMKAPTAIQKNTIPQLVRDDSDAFLQAETGSGKTLAYLLPIVQRITALTSPDGDGHTATTTSTGNTSSNTTTTGNTSNAPRPRIHRDSGLFAIVLAPTRELCKQIAAVLERLLRCAPWLVSTTVTGGESKKAEKARLRKGVNLLIATPGRLADHLDHTRVLDVSAVRWLVLDEGDRMMEMGFEEDLRAIVARLRREARPAPRTRDGVALEPALPARRVTVLCSATMKMNVQRLGEISLQDAVHITAASGEGEETADAVEEAVFAAPAQLKQSYLVVPAKLRLVTLISLLRAQFARRGSVMKAIVFISCADSVDFHFDLLKNDDTAAATTAATAAKELAKRPLPSPPREEDDDEEEEEDEDEEEGEKEKEGEEEEEEEAEEGKEGAKTKKKQAQDSQTAKDTASTVAPAAYLTSPANPTILLHRLHGSLPQPVRTATLRSFASARDPAVLLTTDIASRGLDVPSVDLVVEYDPAFALPDHLHRVGRTARAGRPGRAVLFLMPGCEEGYVDRLRGSSAAPPAPQLYDAVLQKGLASPVPYPASSSSSHPQPEKQSYAARAEALQLHLEQRLLAKPDGDEDAPAATGRRRYHHPPQKDNPLLESARQAFRSHVRAYATHVREERDCFDITQMHLGHVAKAFGLREAPGGIGGGVSRRTRAPPGEKKKRKAGSGGGGGGGGSGAAMDLDDGVGGQADEDAVRRMREKMKAVMNTSSEFNIG